MSIDGWIALVAAGVFFLLLLSAVFSGSETALTAASRALMHQLERQGSHRAGLANRLIRHQERLIGAILLGNNLVNILASALATSVLIALFGEGGVVYATLGMTALVVVFAEVLPKTLALKRPEQVALAVSPVIRLVVAVLGPVTMVVQLVVDRLLRLFGLNEPHDMSVTGADELRGTLALQASEGRVVKAEKDMLDSILDLSDIEVGEIMVHRSDMVAIDADLPSREIVDAMLASSYTRVPLWRGNEDNIVGVLHARDLLHALGAPDASAGDIDIAGLLRPPWFVPETRPVGEQLNAFRARRQHFALVVDEYGAVMGLVTLEDLLEEIVDRGQTPLLVALDGVTDPRNLGAIIRSTAAFGGQGLIIPQRRSAGVNSAAWKTSAGAAARIPVAMAPNLTTTLKELKKQGVFVLGLDGGGEVSLPALELADRPVVIVVGSEGKGLSRLVTETCDQIVSIPISSATESLNAGIAASVALYQVASIRAASE